MDVALVSEYNKTLAHNYNDREGMIASLRKDISLYNDSPNRDNLEALKRIEKYEAIILYAELHKVRDFMDKEWSINLPVDYYENVFCGKVNFINHLVYSGFNDDLAKKYTSDLITMTLIKDEEDVNDYPDDMKSDFSGYDFELTRDYPTKR